MPRQASTDADARLSASRAFAIAVARHAAERHCEAVSVLDLTGLSPVCDFFVIATGNSSRQMRTIADEIDELATEQKFAPLSSTGQESESWILVDCIDVIFHIFSKSARSFYDLDNLWGDARPVEWRRDAMPAPTSA